MPVLRLLLPGTVVFCSVNAKYLPLYSMPESGDMEKSRTCTSHTMGVSAATASMS